MKKWLIFIVVALIIGLITGFSIGEIFKLPAGTSTENFGDIGSFFGGIFGITAVIISIIALLQAKKAFYGQNKQFEIQSFENGFFNLISLFTERVNSLEKGNLKGNFLFTHILTDFKNKTNQHLGPDHVGPYSSIIRDLVDKTYRNEFSVLLLHFKTIADFIDKSGMKSKQHYFSIFYSFLTVDELELLRRISVVEPDVKTILDSYPSFDKKN